MLFDVDRMNMMSLWMNERDRLGSESIYCLLLDTVGRSVTEEKAVTEKSSVYLINVNCSLECFGPCCG